jgi:hypothetical protein
MTRFFTIERSGIILSVQTLDFCFGCPHLLQDKGKYIFTNTQLNDLEILTKLWFYTLKLLFLCKSLLDRLYDRNRI